MKVGERYEIVNDRRFQIWYLNYEKQLDKVKWLEINMFEIDWIVSIESYNSTDFNATLNVNILPEKNTYFTFRSITGSIHINPMSFDLVNIKLFKTNLDKCISSNTGLCSVFTSLFNDREFHIFTRSNAVTKEELDLRSLAPKPDKEINQDENDPENDGIVDDDNLNYYRQVFYTWLAKDIILEKKDYLNIRLTQLTISEQREFDDNIDLAMGIYTQKAIQKFRDNLAHTPEARLGELKDLHVYPHKASTGLSVTNFKNGFSKATYKKDKRWLESKVNRIASRRELTKSQMKKVLEQYVETNTVRWELAVYGIENILNIADSGILETERKMIHKAWKLAKKINGQFLNELDEFYEDIPEYYYNRSYSIVDEGDEDDLDFG